MEYLTSLWNSLISASKAFLYAAWREVLHYVVHIGDALSQLINVVVFFSDNPNESVSGRAWRLRTKYRFWGILKVVIDFVASPLEEDHCEMSHKGDVSRAAKLLREQGT